MMNCMCSNFSVGDEYNGFKVLKVFPVSDYHGTCFYLRHKITGLDVLHLFCDDSENLFAFNFRTGNTKGNGAAHIMEHSVLCGSELFPLKDPFTRLSNQSVKTYLNAATYPDKTVYPASSTNISDYFNLMKVYADAVFFPRLSEEVFFQEACRLQLEKNDVPELQGVVYNEMKGNYSSFESVSYRVPFHHLLKSTIYEKDSGGDPVEIPGLTYEEYLDFHKTWYRPDNCLLFLYGNIPLFRQLDFLNDNFIKRLEKKYSPFEINGQEKNAEKFRKLCESKKSLSKRKIHETGPGGENEKGETVFLTWKLPHRKNAFENMEMIFLVTLLLNHDGSPLQKVLVECGLGEDTAPGLGLSNSYNPLFTAGLRGVKKHNVHKLKTVIFETLSNLAKNGIKKQDIQAAFMTMEFSHREIRRTHGPYALSIMRCPVNAWLFGDDIEDSFLLRKVMEEISRKITEEKGYLESLIEKFLLNNSDFLVSRISPSKNYLLKREKLEKKTIKRKTEKTSLETIKLQNERLLEFQKSFDDVSCLPHLCPKDFIKDGKPVLPSHNIIHSKMQVCSSEIDFFESCEETNGISYIKVGFPVDLLTAEEYQYLPLLAETVCDCGWGALSWTETAEKAALSTGGITASLLTNSSGRSECAQKYSSGKIFYGRDWIVFSLKVLDEKVTQGLALLADNINLVDFSDAKRIKDIVIECRNDALSGIVQMGHQYAVLRSERKTSRVSAVDELWNGLSSIMNIKRFAEENPAVIGNKLREIFEKLRKSGGFIHITGEKNTVQEKKSELRNFAEKISLSSLKEKRPSSAEEFIELTELKGCTTEILTEDGADFEKDGLIETENIVIPSQVGFASECISSVPFEKSGVEEVCCHWLSNILLWERIRTMGGAYGAFCDSDPLNEKIIFATYRDPSPEKSIECFSECLVEAEKMNFSQDDVEKAVMGSYSEFITPKTPRAKGTSALISALYGIMQEDREKRVLDLLLCDDKALKEGFKRMNHFSNEKKYRVIIGNRDTFKSGKITILPI